MRILPRAERAEENSERQNVFAVGSTSSCPVLLASEMSGLPYKVHPCWRPAGGCTRGAAAPLVGGAACIGACQRSLLARNVPAAWGEPSPPRLAPGRGKRERGRSNSLLPQAIVLRRPPMTQRSGSFPHLGLCLRQTGNRPARHLVRSEPHHQLAIQQLIHLNRAARQRVPPAAPFNL